MLYNSCLFSDMCNFSINNLFLFWYKRYNTFDASSSIDRLPPLLGNECVSKLLWLALLEKEPGSTAFGDKLLVSASVCWILNAISCWSICLLTLSISKRAFPNSLIISVFSFCRSSAIFLVFSSSWVSAFFSSNACILSFKCTCNLSLDSKQKFKFLQHTFHSKFFIWYYVCVCIYKEIYIYIFFSHIMLNSHCNSCRGHGSK